MIIDSHQHFWIFDPVRDAWIDESMQKIRRDFLPSDLKPIYDQLGIDGCISVQADQSEDETHFLLEQADENPFIKGVVGWVDLRAGNIDERLEYFAGYEKLAGFRHILQAEEPERMLEKDFLRGINALKNYGFTYDILIYPHHLDAAFELVKRFPGQKFIVDHMAKPEIKKKEFKSWSEKFVKLSQFENVWCKVSGLITEADHENWTPGDLKPYLDFAFEAFGSKRLVYGSDWPVCLLAGSYKEVYSTVTEYLSDFTDDEKRDVLGRNAIGFYDIDESKPG